MRSGVVVTVVVLTVACASEAARLAADGTWVGTITTEGEVTTVINESGSVWGGSATYVEELSIGVESGPEGQMLGTVTGVWSGTGRVYVLDRGFKTLRVFDDEGRHQFDIGRAGAGPGEFAAPGALVVDEKRGRIYVRDDVNARISVFELDGELVDDWSIDVHVSGGPMILGTDGFVYTGDVLRRGTDLRDSVRVMVPYGDGGFRGEPIPEPRIKLDVPLLPEATGGAMSMSGPPPYSPRPVTAFAPSAAYVVGTSDTYSFEIRHSDGEITRIERIVPPVTIDAAEADWHRRAHTARMRQLDPSWSWGSVPMPDQKPFYEDLLVDHSGRIWVRRAGPGTRVAPCDETPTPEGVDRLVACWEDERIFEVFDQDGRFLGAVDVPGRLGFNSKPYIRDDLLLAIRVDEAGTIMVKRYRMVLPGKE